MTFLSVTRHARTYKRTYVRCENRSSIQSLVLMRLAIMFMQSNYSIACSLVPWVATPLAGLVEQTTIADYS